MMSMQGYQMDPMQVLMQARAQSGGGQSSPGLIQMAMQAAPFIIKGLGGGAAAAPTSDAAAKAIVDSGAQAMSTPTGSIVNGMPIPRSMDPLFLPGGALEQQASPIMQGLGGTSGPSIPSGTAMTPGLQQRLAQNRGAFIR